jgi:hypothetical protein
MSTTTITIEDQSRKKHRKRRSQKPKKPQEPFKAFKAVKATKGQRIIISASEKKRRRELAKALRKKEREDNA